MWKWLLKASNHLISLTFSKLFFPLTVYGLEHYPPKNESVLLALNHESKADSFLVLLAVEEYVKRQVDLRAFVAALHMDAWYGWWLRGQDMYVVRRGDGFEQLDVGIGFLRCGGHLAIFPEARIRRGRSLPARKGIAYIAHKTGVPILPIHIEYIPSRYFWYRKCIITIGAYIDSTGVKPETYQEFADMVMREVDSLPAKRNLYQKTFQHV